MYGKKLYEVNKMSLVHTLLFMLRQGQDMKFALSCLRSLEKSTYKTIVVYNQGNLTNENLKNFFKENFKLDRTSKNTKTK